VTWTSGSGNKVATGRFGRTNAFAVVGNQFPNSLANAYEAGNFNTLYVTGFLGGRSFNPGLNMPGYTHIPQGNHQGNAIADIWEGAGDFTLVKGKHTLQLGGDVNTNGGNQPMCVAKTLLMCEINGLHCDPDVAEAIAAVCYS
jgi:hypothetical protein